MKYVFFVISFFVISIHAEITFQHLEHSQIDDTTWSNIDEGLRSVYAESTAPHEVDRILQVRRVVPENVLIARENGQYVGHMFYAAEGEHYLRMGSVGARDMSDKRQFIMLATQMLTQLESKFPQQIISGCMSAQREKLIPLFHAANFREAALQIDPKNIKEKFGIDVTQNYHWFIRPRA